MKNVLIPFLIVFMAQNVSWSQHDQPYQVGFLVMDGTYNSELTAPYDIFHHTRFRNGIRSMEVFSVSQDGGDITTFEGLRLSTDYSFETTPHIDILVIPAAEGHLGKDLENEEILEFIQRVSEEADYVMTLCDGAFLLAQSGLPDNTHVTTFPGDIDEFEERFPRLNVHSDVVFVHDGKYISGVGGARSFEPALYLCELFYGKKIVNELAKGMVIDWELGEVGHFVK